MNHTITEDAVVAPKKDFRYILGWLYLKIFGWKAVGKVPPFPKFLVVAAPHTSNWDLPLFLAVAFFLGVRVSWIGKHTIFRGPFGSLFRWFGGIPIDRQSTHNAVDQMIQIFKERDHLILGLAPEGTRRRVESWKSGFYHIAVGAGVPIVIGFIDYKKKIGGVGLTIQPSGNIEKDMALIRDFFHGVTARYPENFGPVEVHIKK
jgi:1-acyl-sn-glycerol-3-phosphate acyltransferase